MNSRRTLLVLAFATLVLGWAGSAAAQAHSEYEVKAAVLSRVARVFSWPDGAFSSPEDSIRVGVVGQDPFAGRLEKFFEGKLSPQERAFAVVAVHSLEQALTCHVVFVPTEARELVTEWLDDLDRRSILLVGESSDFVERDGGVLSLIVEQGRTRMVLNVAELAESGLQASSQFLRLCTLVGDRARR